MNSYICTCNSNYPFHYNMGSLHWCFHCSYSTPLYPSTITNDQLINTLSASEMSLLRQVEELKSSASQLDKACTTCSNAISEVLSDDQAMAELLEVDNSSEKTSEHNDDQLFDECPQRVKSGILGELHSTHTNSEEAIILKSHLHSQLHVLAVGDTIPKMVGLDDLSRASIKGPSSSIKGNRQELDMEFGRTVFDAMSKRDISALLAVGLHDCKWVDTGQVSGSSDIPQYNQIALLGKNFDISRIIVGHIGVYLNDYYLLAICCYMASWVDTGQELKDDSGCTPPSIDPLSSSSNAHNPFDEIAKRSSCVAMLDDCEYISEVEGFVECIDNLTSFDPLFRACIAELVSDIVPFDTWMDMSLKFEKSGIASSLFDEMPDNNGAYRYSLISENVVAQHMLLHLPFDPRSSVGLVFDNVELVFDNSLSLDLSCIAPISTLEFGEKPMVPIVHQLCDTISHRFYCSKFWGDSLWTMELVGPRFGSFVAIDFSVKYLKKSLYMLVLTCVSAIGLDIAGRCCVGLDSRPDHNVLIHERHAAATGSDFGQYKIDYGTLLFSGFHSRAPLVTSLAQVLDALIESIPYAMYGSWIVCVSKGEFLSSIGLTKVLNYWKRYTGHDSEKEWRKPLNAILPMLAAVVTLSPLSIRMACGVYIVACGVGGKILKATLLHDKMVVQGTKSNIVLCTNLIHEFCNECTLLEPGFALGAGRISLKVQPYSYFSADFVVYVKFSILPFDPGILDIHITDGINITIYTNITIPATYDLIATRERKQLGGLVMKDVGTDAFENFGKTTKFSGLMFSLSETLMFDPHKTNGHPSDVVRKCIAMFFKIYENREDDNNLYEVFSKNIQLDILLTTNSLALSPEVLALSKVDLVAKLAAGLTWGKSLVTTDAEEEAKQDSTIGSTHVLTHHAPCHVYQYECHFRKSEPFMENYSRTWNHLSSFMYTYNWWHIALSYLEKTWVQLSCLLPDAFLWISCKLVKKVAIPWSASWIAEILHMPISSIHDALEELNPTIKNDLKSKLHMVLNVVLLVLPYSSHTKLFGVNLVEQGCIFWFGKQNEGPVFAVALANEAFEDLSWVVNTDKEEHDNTVVFVRLYSSLEDKVLIEGGRIVMNITKIEGPFAKKSNYIWDPGKMPIYRRVK